ncbi:MAG: amino acid permease [Pseudomonadota bacterium]
MTHFADTTISAADAPTQARLNRRLNGPLLILYGLGVTVGAGVYVLVGATAGAAGVYAPFAFLLAAIVVFFTGLSYAEFATRHPVSAGEAAYVRAGFRLGWPALLIGLMVAISGVVSASAISIGAGAYLARLVPLPEPVLVVALVLFLGLLAAWGILQSVLIAGIFTLVEVAGLVFLIAYCLHADPALPTRVGELVPPFEVAAWAGILSASLLAFFAFVGFEDIANVAEEVRNPERTLPTAVIWTLVVATVLYLAVAGAVALSVPLDQLAASSAPLALVFDGAHPGIQAAFTGIAAIATLNGVLIQMIMASRVLYGLADQQALPGALAYVWPRTRTPVVATAFVVGVILMLALTLPIADLAETTSRIVLTVFLVVNVALIRVKLRREPAATDIFRVPIAIPVMGVITCAGMLGASLI